METKRIEEILEKYWEGESSLQEEQLLQNYFQSENIAPHLRMYAGLFRAFQAGKELKLSEAGKNKIYGQLPINTRTKRLWQETLGNWLKVAACIALAIIGSYWLVPETVNDTEAWQQDTYEDPEKAYEEVRQTLMLLSKSLNKGTEEIGAVANLHKGTSMISITSSKKTEP